jgi:hypothetical protein
MSRTKLACLALLCALAAQSSFAAPILTVKPNGLSGGNRQWLVEITPDESLFSDNPPQGFGGSVAVELAFAVDDAELLGVDVNTSAWDTETSGDNPFTGTETDGLWLDLIEDHTFGAFGSIYFTSGDPVRLFTIETSADIPASVRFGTAASGDPVLGARIAQAGENFDGYTGTATVPEPATALTVLVAALSVLCVPRRRG